MKTYFFFRDSTHLFLERREEREKERERNINVWLSPMHLPPTHTTGDLAHNPGMFPHWKWNQQPFCSQASAESAEPHQPG